MSKRALPALAIALLALLAPSSHAPAHAAPAKVEAPVLEPKFSVERYSLANGLRVVLNPDPSSPTVAVVVWYDVGSRNEKAGEGGFAHLFEHMMFEGSANFPRGMHDKLVEGRGGKLNASTSEDWTRYYEIMPAGELGLTLFLEADRMKSLHVDQEAFENQRKVVQEEYRMRVDNSAYTKGYFRLMELVYEGYHPYAHPAIGSMPELDAAKLDWVKAFHAAWYAPNNAVLVVSGDFDPKEARALVDKHFAGVPKVDVAKYPDLPFAGRKTPSGPEPVIDPNARTPKVYFGWSIPKDRTPEHYALELASVILSDGESSRLHRRLVKDLAIAQSAGASTEDHRGPDAFVLEAHLSDKATVEEVEKAIWAELDDLAKKGPTEAEMKKARAKVEHGFLFGLQSNLQRANALAKMEGHHGDASLLLGEPKRYAAVTAAEVKAAVAKYLVRATLAHVRVMPPPKPEGPKPAPKKEGK